MGPKRKSKSTASSPRSTKKTRRQSASKAATTPNVTEAKYKVTHMRVTRSARKAPAAAASPKAKQLKSPPTHDLMKRQSSESSLDSAAAAASKPAAITSSSASAKSLGPAKRFNQILATISRYGLADMLGDNLPKWVSDNLKSKSGGKRLADASREERFRLLLTELGTTFIKLGQVLSTRADLVGPEVASELAQLQSDTPADPPDVVRATVEAELGAPPEELFAEFDYDAMASASIGQVHCATLHDGTEVVIKVQHAGIEQVILDDFEILARLATLAEKHSEEARLYRPETLVAGFRRDLLRELDFGRECRSLERFDKNFEDDPMTKIPKPYPDMSTKRVMTMERIHGTSVKHAEELKEAGHDLEDIAYRGANVFLRQIFEHRFYHADPHPGNIFVLEGGEICLLDCGMTGRLDDRLRDDIEELLTAALDGDTERLTDTVLRLATVPDDFDRDPFEAEVSEFLEDYIDMPIDAWDFNALINDFTGIVRKYRIQLPTNVSLLLRMLGELEGTSRMLSAKFSLVGLLQPYMQDAFFRKFDPQRLMRHLSRDTRDWERLFRNLPRDLTELLQRARRGSVAVNLEHRGLDATINRLIYGVLTAALILGSSQLWSREIEPLIWGQSVPGVILAGGAAFLSTRLLLAIEAFGGLGGEN